MSDSRIPWPGHGESKPASSMRAGEEFYRQDENDKACYMRLYLHSTAQLNGRAPGAYFVNADVLHGQRGEFFADHIGQYELVKKAWP